MSRVIAAFSQFFDGSGAPLANGFLKFLISGTVNTEKNTFADVNQTLPNANPLQLDGEGRCPNVFGQGIYKVVLYSINPVTGLPGTMIQTFDPVVADYQSEGAGGNFADWETGTIYQVGQIVIYNGLYYRSHVANNVGNQPDISLDSWERIDYLRFWNLDVTYGLDDVVIYGSQLYFSLQAMNLNHQPDISPLWWDPVGSGTVLLDWQESGTSFVPVLSGYDLGSVTNRIGDIYQEDNARHYFGDGQDASIYFDSADLYITTVGDVVLGNTDASEIILTTQSFARWRIKSDGHLIPDDNFDIGGAALPIGDVYQGTEQHLYIGDSQEIDINFDGTDFYISIGSNVWALLAAGHIEPQTDAAFNFGSATNRAKQVFVSDDPTSDDHIVKKSYLDGVLYEQPNRNGFRNGDFAVWQRGTTFSLVATTALTADGWNVSSGDGNATVARHTQTLGLLFSGKPSEYALRITQTSTSTVFPYLWQRFLDVQKYNGQTVTISINIYSTVAIQVRPVAIQFFGTGGSSSTTTSGSYWSVPAGAWTHFSQQISIPSTAGKVIGSTQDILEIYFELPTGTIFDAYFANLQIEPGNYETVFDDQDGEDQLWKCQAYYQVISFLQGAIATAPAQIHYDTAYYLRQTVVTPVSSIAANTNVNCSFAVYITGIRYFAYSQTATAAGPFRSSATIAIDTGY